MGAIDQSDEAIFEDVPDFHRRIKAEFLRIAPTQLVRERTLAPGAFLNKANYPTRKTGCGNGRMEFRHRALL